MIWTLIQIGALIVLSVWLFNMALGLLIAGVSLVLAAIGGAWTGIKNFFKQ